jgi:hypothetical protein
MHWLILALLLAAPASAGPWSHQPHAWFAACIPGCTNPEAAIGHPDGLSAALGQYTTLQLDVFAQNPYPWSNVWVSAIIPSQTAPIEVALAPGGALIGWCAASPCNFNASLYGPFDVVEFRTRFGSAEIDAITVPEPPAGVGLIAGLVLARWLSSARVRA